MRRTSPSWRTSVAQDGSCANRTSGTSHYQVPERGSANDGSALSLTCQIVVLPSPSSRLGRDLGALSLEYCICLVELVPLPATTPACRYHTTTAALYLPFVTRCVTYTFIISCAAYCSYSRRNFLKWPPALTTTLLCDEHPRYIALVRSAATTIHH
jgi:hypothetical protein